jgi:cysteine desulfurase/selenocysteine lyase
MYGPVDVLDRRGVVSFSIGSVSAEETCRFLDKKAIALRGGHHCAQPLLRAFGVSSVARASLAPYNVEADVDTLLDGVEQLARGRMPDPAFAERLPGYARVR